MRIDRVNRDQYGVWWRLRQQVYTGLSPDFHDQEMAWLLDSEDAACFLMTDDSGAAVGLLELTLRNFVDGCIGSPVGYIDAVFVSREHRGQGYAKRLIEFAADWFRERGCTQMATDAELCNADAQEFHRRMGFCEKWKVVGFTKSLAE